jgi:hypothetical protein
MARKTTAPTLGQIQDALKAHGFEVTMAAGGVMVTKFGCGAVLVPGTGKVSAPGVDPGEDTIVAFRERPGALVAGQIARLLDRGYQKFLRTEKYEIPATAAQLQAIHRFTEELTQVTGGISLYNEALGTTSDLYQHGAPARPWELSDGH